MPAEAVAQWTLNALLRTPHEGLLNKGRRRLLKAWRAWLVRGSDPLVTYQLGARRILLPLSHDLPLYRQAYPQYAANVARIAKHVHGKYPQLTFIDIGANVGDTLATLAEAGRFPVLCIEGDDRFFAILERNAARLGVDAHLERAFVGDASGEIRGRVESGPGTARIVRDETSSQKVRAKTLSEILERHPTFARSKLIKIDTDGLDCRILRGALGLLGNMKPVIFFEYDPYLFGRHDGDGFTVFQDLRGLGYRSAMVYENTGDYLLTADLEDTRLLQDLHSYYCGRRGRRYADICAFHEQDADLCSTVRRAEIEYFNEKRRATC